MTPDEFARELEKTPKLLIKAKPQECLFAEDYPEGRMQFVCHAMNGEREALQKVVDRILEGEDGPKHLVRALNNLKEIGHQGAILFADVLFHAIPWIDDATRLQKCIQLLDAVHANLRTGLDWLSTQAAHALDHDELNRDAQLKLWIHWCAAILRSSPDAAPLIEDLAPRRPLNLQKSSLNALKETLNDDKSPWDTRAAACFLLLGNQIISLDKAQSFAEHAYANFPLEALEGVEILALAIENDATKLAQFDVIQAKLAQLRHDNLYLRDMSHDAFLRASEKIFAQLPKLPDNPLEIALQLQAKDKNERLILSAFIDDARRADWLFVAHKARATRSLALAFFQHFPPTNPIAQTFSSALVLKLVDVDNADAVRAEIWQNAVDENDPKTLERETPYWIDFCQPETP